MKIATEEDQAILWTATYTTAFALLLHAKATRGPIDQTAIEQVNHDATLAAQMVMGTILAKAAEVEAKKVAR